jgi:hypothetical protein
MATEKQIKANKKNALMSTGPRTPEGKALVSQNAIRHGIFARDLVIDTGDGKEDEDEYLELLYGLMDSLRPAGQMELLLVEKVACDYWRLRRVLRYETGSIRKGLDMAISDYYNKADLFGNKEHRDNAELDWEISRCEASQDENADVRLAELKRQRRKNQLAEDVSVKTASLPTGDDWNKVIKYEKAIQRSILQNLALLKRLQAMR